MPRSQGNRIWGIGAAAGRTCILSSPFGTCRGNVFHNNVGFGWYVNVAFPMRLRTDPGSGDVADFRSCLPFNLSTGEDLAASFEVEAHTECAPAAHSARPYVACTSAQRPHTDQAPNGRARRPALPSQCNSAPHRARPPTLALASAIARECAGTSTTSPSASTTSATSPSAGCFPR